MSAAGTIDASRYLHVRSEEGYADLPEFGMHGEPQALYADEQRTISIQARAQFAETRQEENNRRDAQQWLERLKKAEMSATDRGIDIFRSQATIRKEILNIEQRVMGGTFAPA